MFPLYLFQGGRDRGILAQKGRHYSRMGEELKTNMKFINVSVNLIVSLRVWAIMLQIIVKIERNVVKIHSILHVQYEEPGYIQQWAQASGHELRITRTYQGDVLPETADLDMLVVMGGPQSVNDLQQYPYLRDEIQFVQHAIQQDKPVLGVCLGAQIIARALGAEVQKSPYKEVGLFPLELTVAGQQDPLFQQFPAQFHSFHWHGEMANLPENATLLAQSAGCPHQVFRYGDKVYAFQCHFELTQSIVEKLITHESHDLLPGKYIQTPEQMLQVDFATINQKMHWTLDFLAQKSMGEINVVENR